MKNLLVMFVMLTMSSAVFAHPGHAHDTGVIAQLLHVIATNYLWLSVMGLIGVLFGFRFALKGMHCDPCNDGKDKPI